MPTTEKPIFSFEFVENGVITRNGPKSTTVLELPAKGAEHVLQTFWLRSGQYDLVLRPTGLRSP